MLVAVVNCGSSSIKADVVDTDGGARRARLRVERVGTGDARASLDDEARVALKDATMAEVLRAWIPKLLARVDGIEAVGHRVVHGGERFVAPTLVTDEVAAAIEGLSSLAPLHNPANHAGIVVCRELRPQLPHVAVFDTAFHATLPNRAKAYALPQALATKAGIRRYGFHGTSHGWVSKRAAEYLKADPKALRIITCHLGNGASVAAVEYGRSVETSMGMTPLEGLVMGTRVGDIDAGALVHLMRAESMSVDELDTLLNRESGLAGLSGVGQDVRDIQERAAAGDDRCRLALRVYGVFNVIWP